MIFRALSKMTMQDRTQAQRHFSPAICPAFHSPNSRGSVLIIVLWVSLGLVAIALTFGHAMSMNYRGTDNEVAGHQAEEAIEGAARYAMSVIATAETPGALPLLSGYQSEAVPVGEATVWFIGSPTETDPATELVYGLVDEGAKLNLNTATREMLELVPGMPPELAAAIVDWRDADEDVTDGGGAESETYGLQQPAHESKNADFESVEELALVNGADWLTIHGEDANGNGILDPNEDDGDATAPADDANGKLDRGIAQYVTAFTRGKTTRADGTARVDLAGNFDAVATLLKDKGFADDRIQTIRAAVSGNPGTPVASTLEFAKRANLSDEELDKIADDVRVGADPAPITELINVNTASEAVLACVPGLEDNASTLVAARAKRTQPDTSMLWVSEVLDDAAIRRAGPYLTGRSHQFTADVAAVGRHGRGFRRTRFVIDTTEEAPRIIYRRDLSPLGWALGSGVRQMLAERKEIR